MEPGNGKFYPESQGFMLDPTTAINTDTRPPEFNNLEVKPVRNYSIQTGEEFALEFMLDRVNPRNQFIPDTAGDPHYVPKYTELKGILGINHTGSESGSDISMLTIVERGPKEFERKNSALYEDRSYYGSVQLVPRTSSGHDSSRGVIHGYASSGASDSSSTKMKVLCSFGGKILPRPSDGKLRYVGASWEDLDALVSVSCDEDLQNMMEECNELEDGEGSKKLRMFLFSTSDLDDAYFGLDSTDGDSEIQYVVAVNGMDMGSRKNSTLHGLVGSSSNNLADLDGQNIERNATRVATDSVGISTLPLTGTIVPPSTIQSSQPILPNSSSAYEADPPFYHGQMIYHGETSQHMLHYGYPSHQSNCTPYQERSKCASEGGNSKNDASIQQENIPENISPSKNDCLIPSQPSDENKGKHHKPVEISSSVDAMNQAQVPKSDYDHHPASSSPFAPVYADPGSGLMDLSYLEPPVLPQRVYYSERVPREQAELLNRLSKSDDSLGSQFLISHSRSDIEKQDSVAESTDKLRNGNLAPQTEQSISTGEAMVEDMAVKADHGTTGTKDIPRKLLLHGTTEPGSELPAMNQVASVKHCQDPLSTPPELDQGEMSGKDFTSNNTLGVGDAQTFAWTGSSVGVSTPEQGDILIDINDRFPRDFLSDIFSKAKLAQGGFVQNDVSLMDQDHLGFSSVLTKVEEEVSKPYQFTPLMADEVLIGQLESRINYSPSEIKESDSVQFDRMIENLRTPDSEGENIGRPPLDPSIGDFDINTLQTIEFWREADILSKLHHPNVVAFYGVVHDGPGATLATVTEYMVDGSLRHVLLRKDRYLDRRKRLLIAMDAAFGMEYLHSKNIVHFDLKCDNLLVNLKDPLRPICKVGDFGLSKIKRNTLVSGGVRGPYHGWHQSCLMVDVFSFGIVLWEILTGEEPYANMHYGAIIGGIVSNTLRPTVPSSCDPNGEP
ncbi:putative serine/threonine-protein kinase SIS8 [Vitis vinifera]|uniref:Putative serine/threonine-protein kinase SIS8 n=1 Tax=Vitis vinifera TaxID=29760 RepID=A0A438CR01_VITVI|nr:putative serine/threonine-protein kinase SIS8 [Vitis vinifera]